MKITEPVNVTAPAWLDAAARAVWDELAPDLAQQGILGPSDLRLFAVYCDLQSQYEEATRKVKDEGVSINHKINPNALWAEKVLKIMKSLADSFGLTPAARSRFPQQDNVDGEWTLYQKAMDDLNELAKEM